MPKKLKILYLLLAVGLLVVSAGVLNGCQKHPPGKIVSPKPVAEKKWVPIPLELPKPMFTGHAQLRDIPHLEPDPHKPRGPFLSPKDVNNITLNKPVTSSRMNPIVGTLEMVVDGNKDSDDRSVLELGPHKQWVTIDLEDEYELYAIVFWHFHRHAFRVYYDVVVQVSSDPDFITDVTTLFNNDINNSLSLGVGTDMHYIEKAEGKLVNAKGIRTRYIRLFSQGNSQNDYNHYIEVEAWGRPVP